MLKRSNALMGTAMALSLALTAVAVLSGCSQQQYVKQENQVSAAAVGFRFLPPKVDILMVPDNTPSVNNMWNQLQANFEGFVSQLQSNSWDYHVGRSPIYQAGTPMVSTPILVNPNYDSATLSDGTANPSASELVPSQYAETNAANFPILQEICGNCGNGDNTYVNTIGALNNPQNAQTNFLRADALLAIVVVTNGYDATVTNQYGNYCVPGANSDCLSKTTNGAANLQNYANQLAALKGGNTSLVRFYAVAAYEINIGSTANCLVPGGTSFVGNSYFGMNNYLPGLPQFDQYGNPTSDVCNTTAYNNVLNDISNNLSTISQAYVYSNIVLNDQPIPSTIQVTKNGNTVPQDPNNGWEYMGYGTVYTVTGIYNTSTGQITALNPGLNQETGYVIQLNGSAQMIGSDVPNVTYEKP